MEITIHKACELIEDTMLRALCKLCFRRHGGVRCSDLACVWEAYLEAKDSPPPLVLHTVDVSKSRQDHSIAACRANLKPSTRYSETKGFAGFLLELFVRFDGGI